MKRLWPVIGVVAAIVVTGGFATNWGREEYQQEPEPEIITEFIETQVKEEDVRIREAKEAARASTTAKAQAAYDDMFTNEMNKVEAAVLKEIEEEINDRRLEVEGEIGSY